MSESENPPLEQGNIIIKKRPFLKRRTGLLRFFKNEETADLSSPRQNLNPVNIMCQPKVQTKSGQPPRHVGFDLSNLANPKSSSRKPEVKNKEEDFDELEELKIFEKMEKLTGRSSFGSTTSLVKHFMNNKLSLDESLTEEGSPTKIDRNNSPMSGRGSVLSFFLQQNQKRQCDDKSENSEETSEDEEEEEEDSEEDQDNIGDSVFSKPVGISQGHNFHKKIETSKDEENEDPIGENNFLKSVGASATKAGVTAVGSRKRQQDKRDETSDEEEDIEDPICDNIFFKSVRAKANTESLASKEDEKSAEGTEEEVETGTTTEDSEDDTKAPHVSLSSLTTDLEGMLKRYSHSDPALDPLLKNRSFESMQRVSKKTEYKSISHSKPHIADNYFSAVSMTRLHEQERRQKELKQESLLVRQMREKLEKLELTLREEKQEFEMYKRKERSKLDNYKIKLDKQGLSLEKISEEAEKIRELNLDYQVKMNGLNEKLANAEAEWKRKSNRWEMTNKKQQEQIKMLEKLTEKLETENSTLLASTRSQIKPQSGIVENNQKKKIHFAEDSQNCPTQRPKALMSNSNSSVIKSKINHLTKQNQVPSSKVTKSTAPTGYFSEESMVKKGQDSEKINENGMPLRSAMKPILGSKSKSNNVLGIANQNNSNINYPQNLWESCTPDSFKSGRGLGANNMEVGADESIFKLNLMPSEIENLKEYKSYTCLNTDGDVEKVYSNGTRKYVSNSRNFVRLIYTNGDIKETRPDGSVQYFYSELGIRQYTYPNGLEMTSYSNGQIERKNPDGTTEVLFTNGCVKFIRSDGKEEFIFPDNTVYQVNPSGERVMFLPNGQKEIHTDSYKRRIYPDGTTRTIHENGTFETVYPDGRIRLKDLTGNLLSDTIEKEGVRIPFKNGNNSAICS